MITGKMEKLELLASTLSAETLDALDPPANQVRFLGVDKKTDQTVVVVVSVGTAAEAILEFLDEQKEKGQRVVAP